jgi:restriction endonuclease Mrr
LEIIFSERDELIDNVDGWEGWQENYVEECNRCGWWRHKHYSDEESPGWRHRTEKVIARNAILREYDVSSAEVPLKELKKEIIKRKSLLYKISSKNMELLVKHCFENIYDCEVKHVGKSGDGGIDLVLVNADDPVLVQVKRHFSSDYIEPVRPVRELLGAMYENNSKSCIYVTTAKRFSKKAIQAQEKLYRENLVKRFDLIDFDRFCAMLDLIKEKDKGFDTSWAYAIKDLDVTIRQFPQRYTYRLGSDKYDFRKRFPYGVYTYYFDKRGNVEMHKTTKRKPS